MENLYFRMRGNAFEHGYRLDKMIAGLSGTQQVLEGVYKGVSGKNRLSKQDREHYKLVAYEVHQECLYATIGAVFSGVQQTLPFLPSLSPDVMWEYTKESVGFLYDIYKSAHSGGVIDITQGDNSVAVSHPGSNNKTRIYTGPVYQIGTQIINGMRSLDSALEEDNVTEIELGSKYEKHPAIRMPFDEKGLYFPPTTVDNEPKILHCDIFDFNKYDKIGKLRVASGQEIDEGNYRFKVVGRQTIEEYILSMTETEIEVNCMVEYEHDPLKDSIISMLLIVDIAA